MSDAEAWRDYLAAFHRDRAGVVEAVLSRSFSDDHSHSPYRWLARAVSSNSRCVLDLACGSGPMSRELAQDGRTVIGLDLSEAELALAVQRGPGPWVRGDALALPLADGSVDAVTSSIGLVVAQPLERVIAEISRVLRPGGVLAAIAPALRPLAARDVRLLSRINAKLRTKPQFPGPVEMTGSTKLLSAYGMRRVEDARERYGFTVAGREDAQLVLSALYLPQTRPERIDAAVDLLVRRVAKRGPIEVAIPMRRLVAIK